MNETTQATTTRDHDVELSSDRLRLRPLHVDDAEAIYDSVCESKAQLTRWLPWCQGDYSINDTVAFLKSRPSAFANDLEYAFAIVERATELFVGATGVNQYDPLSRRVNLGYWLRTSANGQGYATEATLMVARWAFEFLDVERIEIVAAVGNEPSQRVAVRAGAQREGIARRRLRVGEVQHDAVVYSLVRGDRLRDNAAC